MSSGRSRIRTCDPYHVKRPFATRLASAKPWIFPSVIDFGAITRRFINSQQLWYVFAVRWYNRGTADVPTDIEWTSHVQRTKTGPTSELAGPEELQVVVGFTPISGRIKPRPTLPGRNASDPRASIFRSGYKNSRIGIHATPTRLRVPPRPRVLATTERLH